MPHIEDVLLWSLAQEGDRYLFGAEANIADADPDAFDCSELVQWSCARAGVIPTVPDGAYNQWQHTKALSIPVDAGIRRRGSLLFVGDGTGAGRDAITHVAWSLGDGTTIEARGSRWGVGTWPAASRFDFAALVPGVDYSTRQPLPPEADMQEADFERIEAMFDDHRKWVRAELGTGKDPKPESLYERVRKNADTLRDSIAGLIRG